MPRITEKKHTNIPGEKSIIRSIIHPDLSKMTDKQLEKELIYLDSHAISISAEIITRRVDIIARQYHLSYNTHTIPLWKLHEDYQACTDRMLAIVEELQYRQIP